MQPKKSLGQNFLRDKGILKKIADFAQIKKEDTVVEVGPGEGTLTELLLERASKVMAIEKDEKLVELLKEKFKFQIENFKLKIICGDVLKVSKGVFWDRGSSKTPFDTFKLIGNIPYYITGALFKKFLECENQPKSITFVVQKEVADRILARDKKESVLSISIKVYGTPEYGGIIKAGSFYPKPKVDSVIIAVRNISKDRFKEITPQTPLTLRGVKNEKEIEKKFFEILKAGFAHKRKFLIKNLLALSKSNVEKMSKGVLKGHPLGQNSSRVTLGEKTPFDILKLKKIFSKCGLQEKARAENLRVEDWVCLTKELQNNFDTQ